MRQTICKSLSLTGFAALALASMPQMSAKPFDVAQGSAGDLGVMSISLKDVVKPQVGFQAQTQAAGTPNEAGIGGFLPLVVGKNSVFFADVLANANFADISNYSSIVNTTVAGTTISTSSRLGYRWLNGNRSWMLGFNAGYDSRPMATGPVDNGVPVTNSKTVFFQQVAASAEAVSNSWSVNAYALLPIGAREQFVNNIYQSGSLDTYGMDVGYNIATNLKASIGYYYQYGDVGWWAINVSGVGSGVRSRVAYSPINSLTISANLSYDRAYDARFSADIKYRFDSNGYGTKGIGGSQGVATPVIQNLTTTPANRDVRVHD